MGIESESGFEVVTVGYQTIKDNVGLLTDDFFKRNKYYCGWIWK